MVNRRTILLLSVFLLLGGAGIVVSLMTGGKPPNRASSLSRSLIGHRGVVELLRRNDFRILVNRQTNPQLDENDGLVVFAPPPPADRPENAPSWRRLSDQLSPELIVLPKWDGVTHPEREDWFYITERYTREEIAHVTPDGDGWSVGHRVQEEAEQASSAGTRVIHSTDGRSMGVRTQTLQFFDGDVPGTVLWRVGEHPVVVREAGTDRVWVSDPDLLSNMFLGKDENASFALALFRDVFPNRQFVVDELNRGHGMNESVLGLLFTFPGIILTLSVTCLMLCFYWWLHNAWNRREPDRDEERRRLEQAEAMGRLTFAHGEHAHAGRQYVSNLRTLMAEAMNLPENTQWAQVIERLDHLQPSLAERLRRIHNDWTRLNQNEADEKSIADVARKMHAVYRELTHDLG